MWAKLFVDETGAPAQIHQMFLKTGMTERSGVKRVGEGHSSDVSSADIISGSDWTLPDRTELPGNRRFPGEPAPGGGLNPQGDHVSTDNAAAPAPLYSIVTDNSRSGFTGTGRNGPVCFNGMVEYTCIRVHFYTITA